MKHILVPTDFSESAAAALAQAAEMARTCSGRITLLHAIFIEKLKDDLLGLDALENLTRVLNTPTDEAAQAITEAAKERLRKEAGTAAGVTIDTVVVDGRPSSEIVQFAKDNDVDLIVMGTHGRSPLGRAFLGSVADHVIRQADCPVMVVRK